jgi:hypothetical protein
MPKKLSLQDCINLATLKGGKCLSEMYVGIHLHMIWECKKGHKWKSTFAHIKNSGTWCPQCSGNIKYNITYCIDIATERNIKCLSKEYNGAHSNMKWQCKKGHQWETTFSHIKNSKSTCPKCAGKQMYTLKDCINFIEKKSGKCLSTKYKGALSRMKWQCKKGHQWETTFSHIKNSGTWCPICGGHIITLQDCKKFAEEKGGKCLAKQYTTNKIKLNWQCEKGHQWDSCFSSLKNINTWCPTCSGSRSEELCREIFEDLLLENFPKKRPTWLDGLELDGYCKKLKIAFEYNGEQHYNYIPNHFHRNGKLDFVHQRFRDIKKRNICLSNNIKLIIIPYTYSYINPDLMKDYICEQLF